MKRRNKKLRSAASDQTVCVLASHRASVWLLSGLLCGCVLLYAPTAGLLLGTNVNCSSKQRAYKLRSASNASKQKQCIEEFL